jgi:oxepin-CoA hydrolase / 3-oxo-5,6-dehydrosuberyl-CoA semialdehyde dehydrogenase
MSDWFFDDLSVGAELVGGARTVTDTEIALLPAFMGAISPLFHDEVAASQGPMGRRILYGPALLGIAIALTEPCFKSSALGLRGLTDVRFRAPVGVGDTVSARLTVVALDRRDDRPGGRVSVDDEVRNQDGILVLSFRRVLLLKLRSELSATAVP